MDKCKPYFYPETEAEIVFDQNHYGPPKGPKYIIDPIDVYDVNGYFVGYSWNYNDSVVLHLHLNRTILHSDPEHLELFEIFLEGKLLEVNFTDIRGNLKYSFTTEAQLNTDLPLNTDETNLIERNTYKMNLVLVTPETNERISLLIRPYDVYVK